MERTLYTHEDQAIVDIARDLCSRLNAAKFSPQSTSWVAIRPKMSGDLVGSDTCAFGQTRIFMPAGLRGKLKPDEIRSMITPALIFQSNSGIRLRYNLVNFFRIPCIFGMLVLGLFVGLRLLNLQRGSIAANIFAVAFLTIFFLSFLPLANRSALYVRKLWLAADIQAAGLVGKQDLLRVLERIDSMKLGDIEQRKTCNLKTWSIRRRPSWRPSIIERVENLELNAT